MFDNGGTGTKEDETTLHELEQAIAKLTPAELSEFCQWFLRFDGERWDEQIEKDATSGKLELCGQSH
jgi:hypothetical protein